MKLVTLLRHAHAEKEDPDIPDFERRLDKRGRREAERMAARAHALKLRPDHLLASPAARTLSTASEFARALGIPLPRVHLDERLYLARRATLAAVLGALPESAQHVLLVGHNPGISDLARWLSDDAALGEFPTATLCTLSADVERWEALGRGSCRRVGLRWPDDGEATRDP
jgi:phosphohistidine phosphatase